MDQLQYPFNLPTPVVSQPQGHWRRRGASETLIALGSTTVGHALRNWSTKAQKGFGNTIKDNTSVADLNQKGLADLVGYTAWHYWAHGPTPEQDFERMRQVLPAGLEKYVSDNGEHPAHRLLLMGAHAAFAQWVEAFGLPKVISQAGDTLWHTLAWHGGQGGIGLLGETLDLSLIDHTDERGLTPLIIAAHRGTREDLEQWLLLGANPDIADRTGCTLLHHVARYGEADWYGKMLDMGADDELRNDRKQTPESILQERVRHSTPQETRLSQYRYWEIAYFHKTHM